MAEETTDVDRQEAPAPCESPPPAAMPQQEEIPDARAQLHRLACELIRTQNRRLLAEFLQLRGAVRS